MDDGHLIVVENGKRISAAELCAELGFPWDEATGRGMAHGEDFGGGGGDLGEKAADGVVDFVVGKFFRRGKKIDGEPGAVLADGVGAAQFAEGVRDGFGVVEVGAWPVVDKEHGILHAHDVGLVVAADDKALAVVAVVEGDAVGAGGDLAEDRGVEIERFAEQENEGVFRAVFVGGAGFGGGGAGGLAGQGTVAGAVAIMVPRSPKNGEESDDAQDGEAAFVGEDGSEREKEQPRSQAEVPGPAMSQQLKDARAEKDDREESADGGPGAGEIH